MSRIFILFILIGFASCTQKSVNKKSMVGKYSAHLEIDEKTFDKQGVKDSITNALSKAKEELSKISVDFDENMDTSTAEGKMEYFAKSFGRTMTNFGKELGQLGIIMGQAAGDVAVQALAMTENLVSNIKLDVELKENGEVSTYSTNGNNIQFSGTKWEVTDNKFIFKDDDGRTQHEYTIADLTDNGFVLIQDKYRLVFERKLQKK